MNNDYRLEDAEDAAVNKSRNLKRGLAAGAAIIGVGGVSAYAATNLSDNGSDADADPLTEDELLAAAKTVAEAAVESEEQPAPKAAAPEVIRVPVQDPELVIDETSVVYDEFGNVAVSYDSGKYNGKDFMVFDTDNNGKGDVLAYDANANGLYEEHEITRLDNESYNLGKGENLSVYVQDERGDMHQIWHGENRLYGAAMDGLDTLENSDDTSDIQNDFDLNEKTGEVYHHDLAENNPDYDNNGGEQYAASDENFADFGDVPDYGYNDNSNDYASYDSPNEAYDEGATYEA